MKLSIITVVKNNLAMIKLAVESFDSQINVNAEHIIWDGCSNDGTYEFLSQLPKTNNRIIISGKDSGIYDAINKASEYASGDIIGLLHSDDYYPESNTLSAIQDSFININPDLVYGDLCYVSRIDTLQPNIARYWVSGEYHRNKLRFGWMPPHPTFYIKKNLFLKAQKYNTAFSIAADYDFMLKCLLLDKMRIHYIPSTLMMMRIGGNSNKSIKNILRKSIQDYKIANIYFNSPLAVVIFKNLRKISQINFRFLLKMFSYDDNNTGNSK